MIEPRLDECSTRSSTAGRADGRLVGHPDLVRVALPRARHVTVALSGDGGDETFAGYDFRYVPHALEARPRALVPGALGPAARAVARRDTGRGRAGCRGRCASARSSRTCRAIPRRRYYLGSRASSSLRETRTLLGLSLAGRPAASPVYDAVTEPYRRCPSTDALQRAEYADLKVYMPNDPLVKVDRMSMAHSLEVRCPLLDRTVVELAFRIPAHRKLRGRTGKVLLRELARRRLPPALAAFPSAASPCRSASGLRAPTGRSSPRRCLARLEGERIGRYRGYPQYARRVSNLRTPATPTRSGPSGCSSAGSGAWR